MTPMEQFIREYSASIGLNPDIVMRTVLNEGGPQSLNPANYTRQAEGTEAYGREESFGPFQLHMRGGVGERALKAGIDPRRPEDAFRAARFAMDVMKAEGLEQWHGWKGDPWAAHGGKPTGAQVPVPDVAAAPYDPRSDTPSSAQPVGSELPGQPVNQYALPGPVTPNPTVGGPPPMVAAAEAKKPWHQRLGKGLLKGGEAILSAPAKPFTYDVAPQPAAARIDQPAAPTINRQQAEMQRQQLAAILARLNAGSLV